MSIAACTTGPTITMGEILVEIMATTKGNGFLEPQPLIGPFPSGAPAIFIDQVAKLEQPCGIISAVGNDDFGQLNIKRLREDGVDVSAVQILTNQSTGYAFVRYRKTGERDFVYNIEKSAAGQIQSNEAVVNLIKKSGHLHIMGTMLTLPGLWPIVLEALKHIKAKGGSVSFDPNMRKELDQPKKTERINFVLEHTDLFMPSGDEVFLLGEAEVNEVIQKWIGNTNREVVLKQGKKGAICYKQGIIIERPAFPTTEIDPTGAGDCFDATYLTCRRMGYSLEKSLEFANVAGSLAISKQGPMEGNSDFPRLKKILNNS